MVIDVLGLLAKSSNDHVLSVQLTEEIPVALVPRLEIELLEQGKVTFRSFAVGGLSGFRRRDLCVAHVWPPGSGPGLTPLRYSQEWVRNCHERRDRLTPGRKDHGSLAARWSTVETT